MGGDPKKKQKTAMIKELERKRNCFKIWEPTKTKILSRYGRFQGPSMGPDSTRWSLMHS